ncbi:MAG: hypothetical protein IJ320_03830 [Phascolarctobacterium sp.]|nr:hypothetical protein [Phascolarctobacterium sp.]
MLEFNLLQKMEEYRERAGLVIVDLPVSLKKAHLPFLPATEQISFVHERSRDLFYIQHN